MVPAATDNAPAQQTRSSADRSPPDHQRPSLHRQDWGSMAPVYWLLGTAIIFHQLPVPVVTMKGAVRNGA